MSEDRLFGAPETIPGQMAFQQGLCSHGYWAHDCALCLKRDGECDWGSCTEPATQSVEYVTAGVVRERRGMCERHCDICSEPIIAGERVHDDGAEIAHVACTRDWFRRNFGREGL